MASELRDDQVRLVSVLAKGEPLVVSRRQVYSLPSEQAQVSSSSYIAISYCWGLDRSRILCDDRFLEVSTQLIPALRKAHEHFPDKLFWTDSISIDQEEPGEKAHQVGMMGEIFSAAETVAVWIDDIWHDTFCRLNDKSLYVKGDESTSKARVDLLRRLSQIPWFYRAWTFQEIRLARKAVVMLGENLMLWDDFIGKIKMLYSFEPRMSTVEIRSEVRSYSRFTYEPQDQFFTILNELNAGISTDLASLLYVTWYREASVKHDKVYALLSGSLFHQKEHGISIDYSVAWSALCINAARACINTTSNLKVLRIAGMKQRWKSSWTGRWDANELNQLLAHPSWAPNWWEPPQQMRSSASFDFDERGCFSELSFCCPTLPPTQSHQVQTPFLALKGVLLGIFNVGDPPSYAGGPTFVHALPHCTAGHPQEWLKKPKTPNSSSSLDGVLKVCMSSLVEDVQRHLQGECPCVPYHERAGQQYGSFPPHMGPDPRDVNLKFTNTYFHLSYEKPRTIAGADIAHETPVPAQVLATSVESGDWLVLLEGGGTPFVLRPVIDFMGRAQRPQALMTAGERSQSHVPEDAGCFVLVGEASMCWDQLWPGMWDMYCRAGNFVIV